MTRGAKATASALRRRQERRPRSRRRPAAASPVEALFARRAAARRALARTLARRALARLRRQGVRAALVGSLARGRFRADSDLDFLVEGCGALSRSRVIELIEQALGGFPFDVVFADRADPVLLRMLREEASLGASALRPA